MVASPGRVAALLFLSGLCALIYQIAWLREFRLVFGASTAASAAVLAIFIGGLGAGGLLLGRRVDRHANPLMFYARLEALIAVSAAVTPVFLWVVRQAYVAAGGTPALGLAGGTVVRLLLAALVLAVPTWLMGGTLPAAARAVTIGDPGRRHTALLYGINTLGAVAGSFLGTFYMLEVFGTRRTLWLAACLNLLLALVAQQMARQLSAAPEGPEGEASAEPLPPPAPSWFVLTAAAGVGFAFFLMELVWYRMLGPILGGTIYTFGLILTVALLGIGLGGAIYARFRRDRPATLLGFANTCLLEAVFIAVPYALGDRIALLAVLLRSLGSVGLFWGYVLAWTIVCALVILPAAVVAGYQFPMLIALLGRGRQEIGRQVGLAYASNTAGAIAGSLAGGFGLIPLLSAPGTWRATTFMLGALGLAAAALGLPATRKRAGLAVPVGLAVAAALMVLVATGPTAFWRHSGFGVGRASSNSLLVSPNDLRLVLNYHRRAVRWEADGLESSVAVEAIGPGLAFVINGKIDGNARGDAPTMIMSGLVGAALHPNPRRSLVIGLGTGGTAGWLAAIPSMELTEVIELEPLVLRVARDCAPINHNVMDNPRVKTTVGDAREVLLTMRGTYDVIFSEPSNPYRAGIASLFTQEYYRAAAQRLAEDGLFLQWVQAYEVDDRTIRTVYATLNSVFPEVETWQVSRGDLLLVASRKPIRYDAGRLRARLAEEPYRSGIRYSWSVEDLEGFLSYFVARSSLAREVAARERGSVNTDDQNVVEFGFARTIGVHGLFSIAELREVARARGEDRPELAEGSVDWERVDSDRLRFYLVPEQAPLIHQTLNEGQKTLAAVLAATAANDPERAASLWQALGREPKTLEEATIVASARAAVGDERALPHIERLRATAPEEADALLAVLRARQQRPQEALPLLERALTAYRVNPWPSPTVMSKAIRVCGEMAAQDPALAPRLLSLLSSPFALGALEEDRLGAIPPLLALTPPGPGCVALLSPPEPHVPWGRDWLVARARCYATANDPRQARASAELQQYDAGEPARRFAAGLLGR